MKVRISSRERARSRVWWALIGTPAAWALQEWSGWYVANMACRSAYGMHPMALASARCIQIGMNALFIVAIASGFVLALMSWRRLHGAEHPALYAIDRHRFVAAAAILVSGAFLIGALWSALSALLLPVCEAVR